MSVSAVAVVIPAHDEEELLGTCLASVRRAMHRVPAVPVRIVVVADACTDATVAIAQFARAEVVSVQARSVGAARAAGATAALAGAGVPPERLWIACTDADSTVPAPWLADQLAAARTGADLYLGTVEPDFRDLDEARRRAWHAMHPPGHARGDVHGANLGVRASALLAAGGFEPVPEHEDVRLVARLRALGAVAVASDAARVRTSGRARGRTPGGFARYLRDDLLPAHAALA